MVLPVFYGIFAGVGGAVPTAGFVAGGGSPGQSVVDKFAFSDDSRTTLGTGLTTGNSQFAGMANSAVAGYFAGGEDASAGSRTTRVDKFAFADDSRTTLGTGLSVTTYNQAAAANSGVAGYSAGGNAYPGGDVTTIDKFAFSDDSRTTLGTGLSASTPYLAGAANSGTAAYYGGGLVGGWGGTKVTTVDKFAFPGDSRSTLGTGLSVGRYALGAMANSGTAAYFGGGDTGSLVDTVDKFAFSDDSRTTLGTGLSAARRYLAGMANSGTAGYYGGGYTTTGVATVDKFAFPGDGRTTLGTGLSTARFAPAAMANSGVL